MDLSNAELLDFSMRIHAFFSNEFQYWLSATFAVIVATFIAGDRLTKQMRIWVSLLYLCVSLLYAGRYLWLLGLSSDVTDEIVARGFEPGGNGLGVGLAAGMRIIVFALGVATTLWFISRNRITHEQK